MLRRLLAPVLGLALVVAPGIAADLGGTQWTCSTTETLKVKGLGTSTSEWDGITLSFTETGWVLDHPDWGTHAGTWASKGKTGFRAVPDAESEAALGEYIEGVIVEELAAESVDITRTKLKIKGTAEATLAAVLTVKAKGTATIGGRTRRGSGSLKAVLAGNPAP